MNYDFRLAEKALEKEFERVNDIRDFNQRKVLKAFFDNKVAPEHFYTVSGYGHDDLGREVLDKVFAQVFCAEKALVRIHFASGTHTLACALFGNLKYGDKLLSVAGAPYDTMQEVIGTAGDEETKRSSLIGNGVLYDEVPLVTQALEEADGDGVSYAAVQKGIVADPDGLGGQRHGRRGLHPAHVLGIAGAALVIDGVAGTHIGAHHKKIHGVLCKCLCVEHIQLFRHGVVAELLTVQVAGAQQVAEACVALIVAILGVVADHTADLMGLVVAAEHRTGRNANGTIQHDAMLHQYIQNTGGKHAAHGTAFQHKTRFHICSPLLCAGAQMPDTPYINYSILESVKSTRAENL